jgi:ABC-type glycerol-3-phosphate transport system permease component
MSSEMLGKLNMSKKFNLSRSALYTALFAWLVLNCLPILWMGVISFRDYIDAFSPSLSFNVPFTVANYSSLWIDNKFYQNFYNTCFVTFFVVLISLSIGCLAGYGLSRYKGRIGFMLLLVALAFRAIPHSTLLPSFFTMFDALGIRNTSFTLILVLVSINQPFTIWMLRSFFIHIPTELDEAAQMDGCSSFQAFFKVIVPVMWPGIVTTGLFSFLLAYNDFLLSSALTNTEMMTMPAAIANAIHAESESFLMQGIAGAVSITIPLILLIAIFQKQIVSGLTQGAVKG